jgi:hypothetical protein
VTTDFAHRLKNWESYRQEIAEGADARGNIKLEKVPFAMGKTSKLLDWEVEQGTIPCAAADGKVGSDFLKNYTLVFHRDRAHVSFFK